MENHRSLHDHETSAQKTFRRYVSKRRKPSFYLSFEWTFKCLDLSSLRVKHFPQTSHEYGFSPVWVLMWVAKWSVLEKARLHTTQAKGLWPVWILICLESSSLRENILLQWGHCRVFSLRSLLFIGPEELTRELQTVSASESHCEGDPSAALDERQLLETFRAPGSELDTDLTGDNEKSTGSHFTSDICKGSVSDNIAGPLRLPFEGSTTVNNLEDSFGTDSAVPHLAFPFGDCLSLWSIRWKRVEAFTFSSFDELLMRLMKGFSSWAKADRFVVVLVVVVM